MGNMGTPGPWELRFSAKKHALLSADIPAISGISGYLSVWRSLAIPRQSSNQWCRGAGSLESFSGWNWSSAPLLDLAVFPGCCH
jgi:hypothetical protein